MQQANPRPGHDLPHSSVVMSTTIVCISGEVGLHPLPSWHRELYIRTIQDHESLFFMGEVIVPFTISFTRGPLKINRQCNPAFPLESHGCWQWECRCIRCVSVWVRLISMCKNAWLFMYDWFWSVTLKVRRWFEVTDLPCRLYFCQWLGSCHAPNAAIKQHKYLIWLMF